MWILLGWCVAKTGGRCYPSLFSSRWSFFPSWYRIRQPLGGAQQVKLRSPLVNRSQKDGLDKEVVVGMTFSGAWFWDSMIQWPNSDPWCWYIYIYANMTGVYGWDPCYHYYSSMDPNWVMIPLSLKKHGEIHGIIPWSPSDHPPVRPPPGSAQSDPRILSELKPRVLILHSEFLGWIISSVKNLGNIRELQAKLAKSEVPSSAIFGRSKAKGCHLGPCSSEASWELF